MGEATLHTVSDTSLGFADDDDTSSRPLAPVASGGAKTASADVGLATEALRAFASMARTSQRHQAEVDAALHRAGLVFEAKSRLSILRYLADEGCIDGQIPLSDGALILTVTATGMSRAGIG